jgi:small subunit ribosomal protein S8
MVLNDPIADALSKINNAEKAGQKEIQIVPVSNLMLKVLDLLNANMYLGDYTVTETTRGRILKLNLIGHINKCGAIKPRFAVTMDSYDRYEKQFLPAVDFGILIISTPYGLMTHIEAKNKNTGGRLIAYCY